MNTPQKFEFLLKKLVQILLSMLVLSILVFFYCPPFSRGPFKILLRGERGADE
ncbi:MAG: hypothetical protein ACLUL2_03715 [Blautia sp.]